MKCLNPHTSMYTLVINTVACYLQANLLITESGGGGASHKEVTRLRKESLCLQEENNFLKLKIDILLDMVSHILSQFE